MIYLTEKLKEYFEEQTKKDPALAAVYNEDRLSDCAKYIRDSARKLAVNGCACVEDNVVYKWARDFFYGDTEHKPEQSAPETRREVKAAAVVKEKKKKPAPSTEMIQGFLFDMEDGDE